MTGLFFRDENGFKCHTMSEAHQRQLLIFAETPDKFLDTYSKEFEEGFLNSLRRTHGTKRVFANDVSGHPLLATPSTFGHFLISPSKLRVYESNCQRFRCQAVWFKIRFWLNNNVDFRLKTTNFWLKLMDFDRFSIKSQLTDWKIWL